MIIQSDTFADLYGKLLTEIYTNPDYENSPRGLKQKELTNVELILNNPYSNSFYNTSRCPMQKYLYGELYWYFSGDNKIDFISKYSKFWDRIKNDDGTLNSAYGYLLFNDKNEHGFTEWNWAYTALAKDKDTRQSIIRFNKPRHSFNGNKDFVCTLNGIFNIRDNKLNFTTTMRSQDMWFGLIYDLPYFSLLQQQMLLHLLPIYPDLEIGDYHHYIISAHIYEKNFKDVEKMLKHDFHADHIPFLTEDLIDTTGNCLIHKDRKDKLVRRMLTYVEL